MFTYTSIHFNFNTDMLNEIALLINAFATPVVKTFTGHFI